VGGDLQCQRMANHHYIATLNRGSFRECTPIVSEKRMRMRIRQTTATLSRALTMTHPRIEDRTQTQTRNRTLVVIRALR
jgi:hypothetical protein